MKMNQPPLIPSKPGISMTSIGSNFQEPRRNYYREEGCVGYPKSEEELTNPTRKYIDKRQYYITKDNFTPTKYISYDREPQWLNPTGIYLDVDCSEDIEKMISLWIKENRAIINQYGMSKDQVLDYIKRTLRGSTEYL